MSIAISPVGQAFLKLQAEKIMRAFDDSVDVKSSIEGILEDTYTVGLTAGVTSGVESITNGTFKDAVKAATQ